MMNTIMDKGRYRQALTLINSDRWDEAHRLIQDFNDPLSCRIHGLLHRIEGDLDNAAYWYRRAGSELPNLSIKEELTQLLKEIESS